MKVVSARLVGCAYRNGHRVPGFGEFTDCGGNTHYVSEADAVGFNGVLDCADKQGYDTSEYRARLDVWVKTGRF